MKYARKRTYKRRRNRRRTRFSRFRKRNNRSGPNKVYYYTRYGNSDSFETLVINNITSTRETLVFQLDDVAGFTEFTKLYDFYKINAVKVFLYPQMTENVSSGSINNPYASTRFYSVLDYNDNNTLVNADEAREYKSMKVTSIMRPHIRYFKPKILDFNNTYQPKNPWISCDFPETKHYALKVFVEPTGATSTAGMNFSIEVKFYLAFKNTR